MLTAQRDSIRLLRAILVASVVLPAALFGYASWLAYDNSQATADRQIEQTRDIITEHALKVFESVERSLAEINEIVRDLSDSEIAAREAALHQRLRRLARSSRQIKSLWVFDRHGKALVNSLSFPSGSLDYSDRDYFKAHVAGNIGTFVGAILQPRQPYDGAAFFGVSRRRPSSDGSFAGVTQASLLPGYFVGFYAKLGGEAGGYAALIRANGQILARVPAIGENIALDPHGTLFKTIAAHPDEGVVTSTSRVDGVERKVAYRRLPGFSVYVMSGLETRVIRDRWLAQVGSYLIFGLPATAALIAIVLLALARTRKLYEEAGRRQVAEDALKQSQRLEALGRLTGGVAHDFNNLLMVVGGSAQKLRRRHSDPQDQRSLDMIDSAVAKGAGLTRQLLSFSRRHSIAAKVVDLGRSIAKFSDVLRQSVRSDIAIEIAQPAQPVAARIDPNEFEIALLNLTLNARDAMPEGGRISISLRTEALNNHGPNRLTGDYAVVSFTDTGTGIPDDIREQIFEPFFTTKTVDRGTGLGLSQIYGFVQQSHGAITVDSTVGRGTTFKMYLPRSAEQPLPEPAESNASPAAQVTRQTTLLLVEDHPDVAAVASDYAEQCGYHVLHASSAEAAIELLNTRHDIELVFSDIVMPGMSGLELARLIRDHHPEIPVVLASGYSERTATAVREGFPLLHKPYTMDALRQKLVQAINSRPVNHPDSPAR
ncbi:MULTISPECIES: hybrid sensor histidine kinase/response regulator [Rhodopseudomonas]|uniref:histidine kinase n=1 Tax=Rhodopseudomonas palustris TaxID=1076 RepID=A0A0D7EFP2_RHOPL|nr:MULTISPECIES: hybrid sensor histidine kinase/response regulator [Rhodopseudomonas]KIZ39466.1 histidine kinase [Rhodopseudomonas palustris]MDF3814068.1 response regulator [Rhodopseudomonas sp. BAL398]WOK19695.1 response regulator [Rhodopseudomonas sp. BAL398]